MMTNTHMPVNNISKGSISSIISMPPITSTSSSTRLQHPKKRLLYLHGGQDVDTKTCPQSSCSTSYCGNESDEYAAHSSPKSGHSRDESAVDLTSSTMPKFAPSSHDSGLSGDLPSPESPEHTARYVEESHLGELPCSSTQSKPQRSSSPISLLVGEHDHDSQGI